MTVDHAVVAVVTAGWSPKEDDPLAEYTAGGPKALIPLAGKPMITHVIDALAGSRHVRHIVIVALDPVARIEFATPVDYVPDAGSSMANMRSGIASALAKYPDMEAVLICSSDVPTITPHVIDSFIEQCFETDHEVYYSLVERCTMEARFPAAQRTYITLRDGQFAGGDLGMVRAGASFTEPRIWEDLSSLRKNVLRQARLFGVGFFLKLLTRRLSIADAERRALQALGIRGRGVRVEHAEAAMDVDKPAQLEIVRAELEARARGGSA